jgi:hypothetical protein
MSMHTAVRRLAMACALALPMAALTVGGATSAQADVSRESVKAWADPGAAAEYRIVVLDGLPTGKVVPDAGPR